MNGAGVFLLPLSSSPALRVPSRPAYPLSRASTGRGGKGGKRTSGVADLRRAESLRRRWRSAGVARGGGADVKSEPLGVSDSVPASIKLPDVASERVPAAPPPPPPPLPLPLEEEREEVDTDTGEGQWLSLLSSGLDSFPKRWVIVLLCFSAFLLCNMDRVNMSIAILPMSAEFNWSPATVGLIQSSFFWGYLLTQIAGGIWADTVGGKTVLAFGVVWWSVATALTPIAAKIGLPFLLVVRAFMGIGEENMYGDTDTPLLLLATKL